MNGKDMTMPETLKPDELVLKPCPFCSGRAEVEWMGSRPMLFVVCKGCGNRSFAVVASHGGTEAEVIAAWNRRAPTTAEAALVKARTALAGASAVINDIAHQITPENINALITCGKNIDAALKTGEDNG